MFSHGRNSFEKGLDLCRIERCGRFYSLETLLTRPFVLWECPGMGERRILRLDKCREWDINKVPQLSGT